MRPGAAREWLRSASQSRGSYLRRYRMLEAATVLRIREKIGGDHQFREEPVEPAHAEERLPDHQNRPLVADRCQRKRHRARATTLKLRWVGRAARALHCRHGRSPRSGPVTIAPVLCPGSKYPAPGPLTARADAVRQSRR